VYSRKQLKLEFKGYVSRQSQLLMAERYKSGEADGEITIAENYIL
jgi:hypothetical protein